MYPIPSSAVFPPLKNSDEVVTVEYLEDNYLTKNETNAGLALKVAKAGDVMTGNLTSSATGTFSDISCVRAVAGTGTYSTLTATDATITNLTLVSSYNGPVLANVLSLFPDPSADSTLASHKKLSFQPSSSAEQKETTSITTPSTDTLIQQFSTSLNDPNLVVLLGGVYELHLTSKVDDATDATILKFKLYHYDNGSETLLGTSSSSSALTTSNTEKSMSLTISNTQYTPSEDRIILRIYANTASSSTRSVETLYAGSSSTAYLYTPLTEFIQSSCANLSITDTTDSTSTNSGALQVLGGIGCAKSVYGGMSGSFDSIIARGTTDSSATNTGSLQVLGGLGCAKSIYTKGLFATSNDSWQTSMGIYNTSGSYDNYAFNLAGSTNNKLTPGYLGLYNSNIDNYVQT